MHIEPECVNLVIGHESRVRPRHHRAQDPATGPNAIAQRFSEIALAPAADSGGCKVGAQQILCDRNSAGEILEMTALARACGRQIIPVLTGGTDWNCWRTG